MASLWSSRLTRCPRLTVMRRGRLMLHCGDVRRRRRSPRFLSDAASARWRGGMIRAAHPPDLAGCRRHARARPRLCHALSAPVPRRGGARRRPDAGARRACCLAAGRAQRSWRSPTKASCRSHDFSIDRVLLVHGLEFSEQVAAAAEGGLAGAGRRRPAAGRGAQPPRHLGAASTARRSATAIPIRRPALAAAARGRFHAGSEPRRRCSCRPTARAWCCARPAPRAHRRALVHHLRRRRR